MQWCCHNYKNLRPDVRALVLVSRHRLSSTTGNRPPDTLNVYSLCYCWKAVSPSTNCLGGHSLSIQTVPHQKKIVPFVAVEITGSFYHSFTQKSIET